MARLSENGDATFVILDSEPIYAQDDIAEICQAHGIASRHRSALWRILETCGRAYLDQIRLSRQARCLTRVRRDLELARRLVHQLTDLTPEAGQIESDRASIALSRVHLSALREGQRQVGPAQSPADLDDIRSALTWLGSVYEASVEACAESPDPEAAWRAELTRFYTRTLAWPWTGEGRLGGERFLVDCKTALDRERAPVEAERASAIDQTAIASSS